MTDKEIIKVLDYISGKLGIAVDWTAENVLPYAREILADYVLYEIISCATGLAISVAILMASALVLRWIYKDYKRCKETEKNTLLWEYEPYTYSSKGDVETTVFCMVVTIIAPIVAFVSLILTVANVFDLLQWCITPEVAMLKEALQVLGGS